MIEVKQFIFLGLLGATLALGCKKHAVVTTADVAEQPDVSSNSAAAVPEDASAAVVPPPAFPPPPAPTISSGDTAATLAELTGVLRRTIARTQRLPSSFEDFVATAQVRVPAPPPGKKYALTRDMMVVLESQ